MWRVIPFLRIKYTGTVYRRVMSVGPGLPMRRRVE